MGVGPAGGHAAMSNDITPLPASEISHWDDDAIISAAKRLGISPGKIYQDDWVGQARQLAGEERV